MRFLCWPVKSGLDGSECVFSSMKIHLQQSSHHAKQPHVDRILLQVDQLVAALLQHCQSCVQLPFCGDPANVQMLVYGIEGVHYTRVEGATNRVEFTKDAIGSQLYDFDNWEVGNPLLGRVDTGLPEPCGECDDAGPCLQGGGIVRHCAEYGERADRMQVTF